MKTRPISLALAALVIGAAGCAVHKLQDYPAKYIVTFSNVLVDKSAFLDFIRDQHRPKWTSGLVLTEPTGPSPIPNITPPPNAPPSSSTSTINLNGSSGLHVTQKVGLYRPDDLKALIGTLSDEN
jgi:hypothetical protein